MSNWTKTQFEEIMVIGLTKVLILQGDPTPSLTAEYLLNRVRTSTLPRSAWYNQMKAWVNEMPSQDYTRLRRSSV